LAGRSEHEPHQTGPDCSTLPTAGGRTLPTVAYPPLIPDACTQRSRYPFPVPTGLQLRYADASMRIPIELAHA